MPEPVDKKLYDKIKKEVYKKMPDHSAYRSGILVKKYKEKFEEKYGSKKSPYKGKKTRKKGLKRWFEEEWVNQRGEVGYKYKNDIYRPKIRITDDTPITHDELTEKEIEKARVKKYRKGRVNRFRKGGKVVPPLKEHISSINIETSPEYENNNVLNIEEIDEEDNMFEELDDELNEYLKHYKIVVKECFDKRIKEIEEKSVNEEDINTHKSNLQVLHSEAIEGDIIELCEEFPNMEFTLNLNFISNIEDEDKETIVDTINETIIEDVHRYINEELGENIEKNDLKEELEKFEYKFNRGKFAGMKEIDYLKIDCVCIIRMIMVESMKQYMYPEDYDSDDEILIESDYEGGKKKQKNKTRKIRIKFKDYPDFRPNLTPREMFKLGSFGGTYWRPIYSSINKKNYKNVHKKYPESWWKDIPENWFTTEWEKYDININKYKVKVGTTLEFWEEKEWIKPIHPYGWVEWYCDFYMGKRSHDDERQISRWQKLAGKKGRFMRFLVTQILKRKSKWDDETVSPKIRQVLQHWGYKLTEEDYKKEINRRKK